MVRPRPLLWVFPSIHLLGSPQDHNHFLVQGCHLHVRPLVLAYLETTLPLGGHPLTLKATPLIHLLGCHACTSRMSSYSMLLQGHVHFYTGHNLLNAKGRLKATSSR